MSSAVHLKLFGSKLFFPVSAGNTVCHGIAVNFQHQFQVDFKMAVILLENKTAVGDAAG